MASPRLALVVLAAAQAACGAEFRSASGTDPEGSGGASAVSLAPGLLPTVSSKGGAASSAAGGSAAVNSASGGSGTGGFTAGSSGGVTTGSTTGVSGAPGSSACAKESVTLRMLAPAAALAGSYCARGCALGWLEITTADGTPIVSQLPCGVVTCDQCQLAACAKTACVDSPLPGTGLDFVWDGTQFLANSCGAANLCQQQSCVPPGRFTAKMCAPVTETMNGSECVAGEKVVCTEPLTFDFPGTALVTGTLPAPAAP